MVNSHQFYNDTNSINVGTNATVTPDRDVFCLVSCCYKI